jgi:peptidylprolyl isomerase
MSTPAPGCDGTKYTILKEGAGKAVGKGATVTVHATGVVQETGTKFWSTKDPGQEPFTYQAGVGQVIKGWDQGLLGMKLGEERQVVIPGHEGYGAAGFPAWGIPPNGTLDFTLEVLAIK